MQTRCCNARTSKLQIQPIHISCVISIRLVVVLMCVVICLCIHLIGNGCVRVTSVNNSKQINFIVAFFYRLISIVLIRLQPFRSHTHLSRWFHPRKQKENVDKNESSLWTLFGNHNFWHFFFWSRDDHKHGNVCEFERGRQESERMCVCERERKE